MGFLGANLLLLILNPVIANFTICGTGSLGSRMKVVSLSP